MIYIHILKFGMIGDRCFNGPKLSTNNKLHKLYQLDA